MLFLQFFAFFLSFEYKKATVMFELILYPATLFKLFITCKSSLVEFFGLLKNTITSSPKSYSLTSFFPMCIHMTSFCCLISLAETSSTKLKRYVERGKPYLVPDFSGISSSFSPFSLMLATGI